MSGAARFLLDSLIDYAGLFPPAALDVPTAVSEYAVHRREPEAWMLGRFIAPAERLSAIGAAMRPLLDPESVWPFSVLVGSREDAAAAVAALASQATAIKDFESGFDGRARVECLESPIPLAATAEMVALIPRLLDGLATAGLGGREVFLEIPAGGDDRSLLETLAGYLREGAGADGGFVRIGAKLRCGGVTADAFPSCERIAAVIQATATLDLPLKCTAGLHHPVRHRASEPDVMMHGFLNVFGAGILARALRPGLDELVACVAETDPEAFTFTAEHFAWRDLRVAASAVREIRRRTLCGFGSCSFAEPRADLRGLGVL